MPRYIDQEFAQVCSLCYEMHRAIDKAETQYWTAIQKNKFYKLSPDPIAEHY